MGRSAERVTVVTFLHCSPPECKNAIMPAAPTRRDAKRSQTALRLQERALRLTLDRGFDGWTMDDLAEAADVSRRTVFNYFDSKADVVLGPVVELDPERVRVSSTAVRPATCSPTCSPWPATSSRSTPATTS
jgi:hypothetical protein